MELLAVLAARVVEDRLESFQRRLLLLLQGYLERAHPRLERSVAYRRKLLLELREARLRRARDLRRHTGS